MKHGHIPNALERERPHVYESEPCRRCGTALQFGTDGMGSLVPVCPHCAWGWPIRQVPPPVEVIRCEHGVAIEQEGCGRCTRKRTAIALGVRTYQSATHQRATYAADRAAAAGKGWATRRKSA